MTPLEHAGGVEPTPPAAARPAPGGPIRRRLEAVRRGWLDATAPAGDDSDRPTRAGYRAAIVTITVCLAASLLVVPFGTLRLAEIPGIMPFLSAMVLTTDLSTSFLLFVLFLDIRRPWLLVLACTYLFAAAIAALNVATFPGVLARDALVWGAPQSYPWITQVFWAGYATLGLAAMLLACCGPAARIAPASARRAVAVGVVLTLLAIWGIGEATIRFIDLLPPVSRALPPAPVCARGLVNGICPPEMVAASATLTMRYIGYAMMATTVALGLAIAGRRDRMALWFSVSIACALAINVLSAMSANRYTLGWTASRVGWMASSSILFVFFMAQFAMQVRQLARAKQSLEQRVRDRTAALSASLRERDLLLREVYHRVNNNMQVVEAMLFVERRRTGEPAARDLIDLLRARFAALGLVHRQLMASDDMKHFDIAPFLNDLVRNIGISEDVTRRGIALAIECECAKVTLDFAIPLGLLVAELLTNSFKHANARRIGVRFRRCDEGTAMLTVEDDGRRVPDRSDPQPARPTSGQGSQILAGLVAQLGGRMQTLRNGGMRTDVVAPLPWTGGAA